MNPQLEKISELTLDELATKYYYQGLYQKIMGERIEKLEKEDEQD